MYTNSHEADFTATSILFYCHYVIYVSKQKIFECEKECNHWLFLDHSETSTNARKWEKEIFLLILYYVSLLNKDLKEKKNRKHIYIYANIAESLCWTPETNTIL